MQYSHAIASQKVKIWLGVSETDVQSIVLYNWRQIDGLVQEGCNSIANALELPFSCTKPSGYAYKTFAKW